MSDEEETEDAIIDLGDEIDFADDSIDLAVDDLLVEEDVYLEENTREIE